MTGRQRLTKFEYGVLFLEQGGRCGCGCGERLAEGKVDEEHSIPNYYRPGKPDSLWLKACHKKKTAKDKADIAKTKRLRGDTGNGPKKKIQSPGFPSKERRRAAKKWKEQNERSRQDNT